MYVDDFLSDSGIVAEGKEIYNSCKQIMKEASFNLRKFTPTLTNCSNSLTSKKLTSTVLEPKLRGRKEGNRRR